MTILRKRTFPDEQVREPMDMSLTEWWEINRYEKNSVIIHRQPSFEVGYIIEINGSTQASWTFHSIVNQMAEYKFIEPFWAI